MLAEQSHMGLLPNKPARRTALRAAPDAERWANGRTVISMEEQDERCA